MSIVIRNSFEKVGVGYLYRILNNQLVESYGEIKHRDEWYYDSKHYEPELIYSLFYRSPVHQSRKNIVLDLR